MKVAKPSKQVIIDSIINQIEKGKGFSTVLALLGSKWHLPKTTFVRYWKKANDQHTEAQQPIKELKAALYTENALNERKRDIADVLERKEVLTKILRGQIPLEKAMVVNGVIEYVEVIPDWTDRKNAISELNKMEGDYAPTKVAQTDKDGNDIKITLNLL
jgi:hypothetical protein